MELIIDNERFEFDESLKDNLKEYLRFLCYNTELKTREYLMSLLKKANYSDFWSLAASIRGNKNLPKNQYGNIPIGCVIGFIQDELSCSEKESYQILKYLVKLAALSETAFGYYK